MSEPTKPTFNLNAFIPTVYYVQLEIQLKIQSPKNQSPTNSYDISYNIFGEYYDYGEERKFIGYIDRRRSHGDYFKLFENHDNKIFIRDPNYYREHVFSSDYLSLIDAKWGNEWINRKKIEQSTEFWNNFEEARKQYIYEKKDSQTIKKNQDEDQDEYQESLNESQKGGTRKCRSRRRRTNMNSFTRHKKSQK